MTKTIKKESEEKNIDTWKIIALSVILIFSIASLYTYFIYNFYSEFKAPDDVGTFGDMYGGLNAIFSGFALGGVILTIYLQKNELELTRKEFTKQTEAFQKQNFENTFFKMVSLHHEIIDKLYLEEISVLPSEPNEIYEKRMFFDYCKSELNRSLLEKKGSNIVTESSFKTEIKDYNANHIEPAYKDFFNRKTKHLLSHYFRNLYHIFKYIYNSDLEKKSKNFYAALARAQLSADELHLLFYNGLSSGYGYPNFLFYMKEFNILDNFTYTEFIPKDHIVIYDQLINDVTLEN